MRVRSAPGDRWAILLHGFTRNGGHLATLQGAFAAQSVSSVAPDLGSFNWFRSVNNPRFLDRIAADVMDVVGGAPVVVGHSAGAAAGAYLTTRLPEVSGLVFVDGNESPTHLIDRSWPAIAALPMVAICAPPNRCNRNGAFAAWARQHDVPGGVVAGSGHGDIEGQSHGVYRVLCGDASSQAIRDQVRDLVVGAAGTLLTGESITGFLDRNSERIQVW